MRSPRKFLKLFAVVLFFALFTALRIYLLYIATKFEKIQQLKHHQQQQQLTLTIAN